MRRAVTLLLTIVLAALGLAAASRLEGATAASAASAASAVAPSHSVTVTGTGVATYPAYDPGVGRYGITTTAATGGTVTVQVTTSEATGRVYVDGSPAPGGTRTITGLSSGDEVSVFIEDSAGVARHSYVYLPADFPAIARVTPDPAPGTLAPGLVLLTLGLYLEPSRFYYTAVDLNGVPAMVRTESNAMDLSPQPNGRLSVFVPPSQPGRTGSDLIELDSQWREVARHRTVGLVNTDPHDAIIEPDGTLWLMAYEPDADTGLIDSVVQRIEPDGTVGFQWDTSAYAEETMHPGDPDYSHINSFQVMADGDLLVSFRNLSSVWKIATHAHDGFSVGDVVWKLGGRDSDFAFAAGDVGPCAQHTARELPNGNIEMYDNGSWNLSTALCVDQSNPTGPAVERLQSRAVEYDLDESAYTATVVRSFAPSGWFAIFAGSTQRQPNGNTLVGWASERKAIASEVDAAGNLLWQIKDPVSPEYFTYRALKADVPDAIDPQVEVSVPTDGATYVEGDQVTPTYRCTDRGGSSLVSCAVSSIDTTVPGTRTMTVTGRDGAGRTTTVTRRYTVLSASRPDAMARVKGGGPMFTGSDVYGGSQQVGSTLRPGRRGRLVVQLQNDGARADRLGWQLEGGRPFKVLGKRSGTSPLLAPGQTWTFTVKVRRPSSVPAGSKAALSVSVVSATSGRTDAISWLLTTRGAAR